MKHIKTEIVATNYIVTFVTKRGKKKTKEYSPYDEWIYNHAPICDEIIVITEEHQQADILTIIEKWERALNLFFSSRCGRAAKILNIEIQYEIIERKYCADMSVKECLEVLTPEQFFNEFGKFAINNLRDT